MLSEDDVDGYKNKIEKLNSREEKVKLFRADFCSQNMFLTKRTLIIDKNTFIFVSRDN